MSIEHGQTSCSEDQYICNPTLQAAYIAFVGGLETLVGLNTPTMFHTHKFNMKSAVISLALNFWMIVTKPQLESYVRNEKFTKLFNHVIAFLVIITQISLISVMFPYNPISLVISVCILLAVILANYFVKTIKAFNNTTMVSVKNLLAAVEEIDA